MEFKDIVHARRSVRSFQKTPVEEEKLLYILEAARLAPSWANGQCWRFIVVQDPEARKAVAKTSMLNRWLQNAPVILVACGDPRDSGTRKGIDYFGIDVAIAFQQMILAATDVGLGTCWLGAFDEEEVKAALKIPEPIRVVALSPLGYAAGRTTLKERVIKAVAGSKRRKPLKNIVHYDHW
jgi:nitroreductase